MMKKEPAILVMVVVYLLNLLLDVVAPDLNAEPVMLEAVAEFLLIVGGAVVVRSKVFSEQTVRNAGFTPAEIEIRAESPTIPPAKGG